MILTAELQMDGSAHLKVNAGFIAALSQLDKQIVYLGGAAQAGKLKKELSDVLQDNFEAVPVNNGYRYSSRLLKEIVSSVAVIKLLAMIRKRKPALVFVLSASPLAKCLLNYFCRKLRTPVIIVCHGELEGLKAISENLLKQSFWTVRFLAKHAENIFPLIMDNRVYRNTCGNLCVKKINNIIVSPHPYVFKTASSVKRPVKKMFRVCFTGTASAAKEAGKLYELAALLSDEIDFGAIEFSFAGSVAPEIREKSNGLVLMSKDKRLIADEEYSRRISNCDMIVFFYRDDQYSLTTSGALFDILDYERPFVALDSELLREFTARYGKIGICEKNIEGIAKSLRKIMKSRIGYDDMMKNIVKAKIKWSVEKYAGDLSDAMKKAGIKIS
jgi:hypothetical protein